MTSYVCFCHLSVESACVGDALLGKSVQKCVVKSKTAEPGLVELNLEVRLKGDDTDFVNDLAALGGVQSAVLVSYNGDYMG